MTQLELKKIKRRRDLSRDAFNVLDEKLRENCHCPENFKRTEVGYETDTLGSNGTSYFIDFCSVCGKSHGTYGGVYGHYNGGAKYPTAKARDFR